MSAKERRKSARVRRDTAKKCRAGYCLRNKALKSCTVGMHIPETKKTKKGRFFVHPCWGHLDSAHKEIGHFTITEVKVKVRVRFRCNIY